MLYKSINIIEFNYSLVGVDIFHLCDVRCVERLSSDIFMKFGFDGSDDYIDYLPHGKYLKRDPFVRMAPQSLNGNRYPFTTVAYATSGEMPYDENAVLFTYRGICELKPETDVSAKPDQYVDVINYVLETEFKENDLLLISPYKEVVEDMLSSVSGCNDKYWFCSNWKG